MSSFCPPSSPTTFIGILGSFLKYRKKDLLSSQKITRIGQVIIIVLGAVREEERMGVSLENGDGSLELVTILMMWDSPHLPTLLRCLLFPSPSSPGKI